MTTDPTDALARIRQMADFWERHLPEVIRTPAVVSALRAAMESVVPASPPPVDETAVERVARRLAARERLSDEARWGETSPEFRDLYRGAAREVIALAQEPGAEPAGERAALRDRIAEAIRDAACSGDCGETEEECAKERIQPFAWHHGRLAVVEGEPEQFADAVLAVMPEPADRGAVLREAADELDARMERFFSEWPDEPRNSPYALGQKDAAAELRRLADETAATDTPGKSCAHCGQPISRVIGTLAAWWVHAPGGNTVCHPEQAGSSPRATPKPAVEAECTCADAGASFAPVGHYADCPAAGARQDGVQSSPPPA